MKTNMISAIEEKFAHEIIDALSTLATSDGH